ncbi:NADP-dependent oxidoreductase [Actinoplanes aureus]|uniref:NADP-dependent oxidoreductase n=1 Tax=Actinoplanes aureus TaxID=2792083 RepID=A0A931C9L3_9ACTN|nr:NADP-dependent oxidoreductase [Actinoplanes aureus]MBG0565989.1 NADP-dependent oxidoreductase [Actinoplanes aureus]
MRAMRMHGYGEPNVIRLDRIDRPSPGPGEVLLKVAATTFNPSEAGLRRGLLRSIVPVDLPYTMGLDVAGTVSGTRVIGRLDGGAAADYAVAPADVLVPVPAGVALEDAAALPIAGLTAWQAVFEHAAVTAGQRVLVNGAGAIGRYAIQLARHAGAYVIAAATPRRVAAARAAGAHEVAAPAEPVDALIHLVPAPPAHTALIKPGGVLVSATTPADQLPAGPFRAVHFIVRNDTADLAALLGLVDAGAVHIDVAARRPLTDLAAVHREAEAGRLAGKTLLLPTA